MSVLVRIVLVVLAASEMKAQVQTAAVAEQLSKEKDTLMTTMAGMEREKAALAQRVFENQAQVEQASTSAAKSLAKEREELRHRMEAMEREKSELATRLAATESHAMERERLVAQRLEQERQELLATVERMKQELLQEKKRMEEVVQEYSQSNQRLGLQPKRSLYDMMSDDGSSCTSITKEVGSFMSRNIRPIREVDESLAANLDDADDVSEAASDVTEDPLQDLPAPHLAAAHGDVKRLQEMCRLNIQLLCSLDESCRTPLFYAVAYNKFDATEFLIKKCPETTLQADQNGDLPLHVACSAGTLRCVDVLVETMGNHISCQNNMGLSPVHLARNRDCLEVLYAHGLDFSVVDENGRSPLFIACAMNRSDCAEYIINCLDNDESAIYQSDSRGDTPLHAAACNGSDECVLLLLQHAIDPRITNVKGLKAIDLAIKNKQTRCREMLAEYHLHYCTSSQFDSVLFLATLQVEIYIFVSK